MSPATPGRTAGSDAGRTGYDGRRMTHLLRGLVLLAGGSALTLFLQLVQAQGPARWVFTAYGAAVALCGLLLLARSGRRPP